MPGPSAPRVCPVSLWKRALPEARRCPVGRHDAGENQNDEQNEIEGVP